MGEECTEVVIAAKGGDREETIFELADLAYARCLELGGVVSSEHGVGYAKCKYLRESLGEAGYALLGRLKAAFDPGNILNPGKIFGD